MGDCEPECLREDREGCGLIAMVRLKHPHSGVVVIVTPEKAERLASAGWLPEDAKPTKPKATRGKSTSSEG